MAQRAVKSRETALRRLIDDPAERSLVDRTLSHLDELGIHASIDSKLPSHHTADYLGSISRGSKRRSVHIEVKRSLRPSILGPLLLKLQKLKPPPLLLTDYVTPQIAKQLRSHDIAFADTVGNAYLSLAGDVLYIVGNSPESRPRAETVARAFQSTGMRVVFTLLCDPMLVSLPTRELADTIGVANGTVSRVMSDLTSLGFVSTAGRRARKLHNLKGLLERWVMMYPAQLRPTLLQRRLAADQPDWWQHEPFASPEVVLGGEAAADRLGASIRPETVTLYVRNRARPINEIIARHRLHTDPQGEIEVLEAFWPAQIAADQPGLAPTLLIYADLLATGHGRNLETASRLHDEYLAERFSATR